MKNYPQICVKKEDALELEQFRKMDYRAVELYGLPVELMMENAGLHLASLAASLIPKGNKILIGAGPGNNGGGGLVAARRLLAWGYDVHLHIPMQKMSKLPELQLKRALSFGAKTGWIENPGMVIDTYFGFSQRLPLPPAVEDAIEQCNSMQSVKLSLDIPTGLSEAAEGGFFQADVICTLAAPKKILYHPLLKARIFVADIGIPLKIYRECRAGFELPFDQGSILQLLTI